MALGSFTGWETPLDFETESSRQRVAYQRHADSCRSQGFEPCTYGEFICNPHEYEHRQQEE